ncbi:MAG: hypothetical protein AAFW76_05180 [Pseudomonadota bacterium]
MTGQLTIGVIRGSLPSYFPQKYKVFEQCEAALAELCAEVGARLTVAPGIPMNGPEATAAVDHLAGEGADLILLIHGGFTMGDVARSIAASGRRMAAWATPEPVLEGDVQLNNFVSLNMTLSIARGVRDMATQPVQWYFGAPDDPALRDKIRTTLRALTAVKQLEGARIGLVGGLAMTFYNMEVSTNVLKTRLGIEVDAFDIGVMTGRMAAYPDDQVAAAVAEMTAAAPVEDVSADQMALTGRAYLALRDIAADGGFAALAVSDWPALQEDPGMHPGAAFTWLEEKDGIPAASEGDILGAVTQLVAKSLSGKVGYLLDMTEPDLTHGDLLVWHGGGGPLYLADKDGARWINHPMIGRGTEAGPCYGAISDLIFQDGPATVFRLSRAASALFAMQATIKGRTPTGFTGCRGWLRDFSIFGQPATLEETVATVMAHGIEHHFILTPGSDQAVLDEFALWTAQERLTKTGG